MNVGNSSHRNACTLERSFRRNSRSQFAGICTWILSRCGEVLRASPNVMDQRLAGGTPQPRVAASSFFAISALRHREHPVGHHVQSVQRWLQAKVKIRPAIRSCGCCRITKAGNDRPARQVRTRVRQVASRPHETMQQCGYAITMILGVGNLTSTVMTYLKTKSGRSWIVQLKTDLEREA